MSIKLLTTLFPVVMGMIDQAQQLRDLMYAKRKGGMRFVTVTGGGQGVGKTSFALNLAWLLKRQNHRPLVIQIEPAIQKPMGQAGALPRTFTEALHHKRDPHDLIKKAGGDVLCLSGGDLYGLTPQDAPLVRNGLIRLEEIADTLVFDAPGHPDAVTRLIQASHDVFLLITPERDALLEGYSLLKKVSASHRQVNYFLVLNKGGSKTYASLILENFVKTTRKHTRLEITQTASVRHDKHLAESCEVGDPYLAAFPAGVAAEDMARIGTAYHGLLGQGMDRLTPSAFLDVFLGGVTCS